MLETLNHETLKTLDIEALIELREQVESLLSDKREQLERMLSRLRGETAPKRRPTSGRGVKIPARYQSKKDPSLLWSGRGALPRWMRAEMKGTRLRKEDFRIPDKAA